ncbi:hypothetical protein JKG47_22830 [Acidithiobacillus sp. MC6.1]|nr:hypothetical protein [Acidithiobacillus sp. MC6.1]
MIFPWDTFLLDVPSVVGRFLALLLGSCRHKCGVQAQTSNPWNLLVSYIVAQITQSPWSPPGAFPTLAGP